MNETNILYADRQLFITSECVLPAPYPRKYIHCVMDDPKDAVSAMCGLRAAGYGAGDMHVLMGRDFVEAAARRRHEQPFLVRAWGRLAAVLEDTIESFYLPEARKGNSVLLLHLRRNEQLEAVSDLLIFHHARTIKYVDTWTVVDLQPSLAQAWAISVLSAAPRLPYRHQ